MSRSGTCSLSPFILYWTVLEMSMHLSLSLSLSRPHTLQLTGNCCSPPDGQWVSGIVGYVSVADQSVVTSGMYERFLDDNDKK